MSVESLSHEQILFLAKLTASVDFKLAVDEAHKAIPVGTHSVPTFAVEVGGSFNKGKDDSRAGTARGLTAPVLGLTLHYAGVTRDAAEAAYTRAVDELGSMTVAQQKRFLKDLAEEKGDKTAKKVGESIDATLKALRAKMPRIPTKGTIKATGFVRPVEAVLTESVEVVQNDEGNFEVVTEGDEITAAIFLINAK